SQAKKDRLGATGPWLSGDVLPDIITLSVQLKRRRLVDVLRKSSDEDLSKARDELRRFLVMFADFVRLMEWVLGKNALGMSIVREIDRSSDPRFQATLLLLWLVVKQKPDMAAGMAQLLQLEETVRTAVDNNRILQLLRTEVPEFSELLSPERLKAV